MPGDTKIVDVGTSGSPSYPAPTEFLTGPMRTAVLGIMTAILHASDRHEEYPDTTAESASLAVELLCEVEVQES